ncbi:NACHT domain-containing protein [Streptomyces sp. B6B3]|uniref:NACHT domain-containing protein n=1 Tax=Streptomyces sp. B6B3 TaxID=3153570 RepID=UPI00325C85BF
MAGAGVVWWVLDKAVGSYLTGYNTRKGERAADGEVPERPWIRLGFARRYRAWVLGEPAGRYVNQKAFGPKGAFPAALDDIYVDVSLAPRSEQEIPAGLLEGLGTEAGQREPLGTFLRDPVHRILAVLGQPGSGKTTLLWHTARQACRRRRPRRVPLLLALRDHVATIAASPDVGLPELVRSQMAHLAGREPRGWLERRLDAGDCLVLLDGLDEVATDAERRAVAVWIEREIGRYAASRFVISSRPGGYRTAPVTGAVVLEVRPFTDRQIERFVRGWYGAQREAGSADDLLGQIGTTRRLRDLAANPLLLTMIANVHRYGGGRLPGNRAELYREICEVVLWKRQEDVKGLTAAVPGEDKMVVFGEIAFAMMRRRVRDLDATELHQVVEAALRRLPAAATAREFLDEATTYGLLSERERGTFAFAHPTLQEYLAAAHVAREADVDFPPAAVHDTWWHEALLLYAAHAGADRIVLACLAAETAPALALAFDCAEESPGLAAELVARLDELLASGTREDADPERRRLVAGVLLSRHLRETVGDGPVCARPITAELYRMFLRDHQDRGEPRPPDRGGDHDGMLVGVRGCNAEAFVRWANEVVGIGARRDFGTRYRLPTGPEAGGLGDQVLPRPPRLWEEAYTGPDPVDHTPSSVTVPVSAPPYAVWIDRGTAGPGLLAPRAREQPAALDPSDVGQLLREDLRGASRVVGDFLLLRAFAVALSGGELDRDHASALARGFAIDRARGAAFPRTLSLPEDPGDDDGYWYLSRALGVDRAVEHVLGVDFGDRENAQRRISMLTGALNKEIDRHFGFEPSGTFAQAVARAQGGGSVRPPSQVPSPVPIPSLVIGSAWWRSLGGYVRLFASDATRPAERDGVIRPISAAFQRTTRVEQCDHRMSGDAVPDALRDADAAFRTLPTEHLPWARTVAGRLPGHWHGSATTDLQATALRLGALCLAVEAETHADTPERGVQVGDAFRRVATTVTAFQTGDSGERPASEVLLLARD